MSRLGEWGRSYLSSSSSSFSAVSEVCASRQCVELVAHGDFPIQAFECAPMDLWPDGRRPLSFFQLDRDRQDGGGKWTSLNDE